MRICGQAGGGGGGEGADTALKTKTPHVNVGKMHLASSFTANAITPVKIQGINCNSKCCSSQDICVCKSFHLGRSCNCFAKIQDTGLASRAAVSF